MNYKNIVIFEGENHHNFYPFNIMHPVWELRCGSLRLFEKIKIKYPDINLKFIGRELHTKSFIKRFNFDNKMNISGKTLLINSQVIPNAEFFRLINDITENTKITFNGKNAGYVINDIKNSINDNQLDIKTIENENFREFSAEKIDYLDWIFEALDYNASEIENDIELMRSILKNPDTNDFPNAYLINQNNIYIGKNVKIAPGCVLDATEGKIFLGDNVRIMPHATIIGPVSVGENSTIKIGAKIYEDSSFGEWCKIGGEIENTIIQSYSNKQHEGFLGHSFVSEWVNLGADTNNSDLKNTYGNIKIRMEDRIIDTGRMFMGLLCGDHTKSSINAMFTTGTVAGICGIVVREWFMPNFIRSFSWGGKNDSPQYHFKKAIETAKIVMQRRNKILTPEEIELMKIEYKNNMQK